MIKPIRPGMLAGLSDSVIERRLADLFQCVVDYDNYVAEIHCVEQYETPKYLVNDLRKLQNVGTACVACRAGRAFVRLEFNDVARDVISGARRERDRLAAQTSNTTIL